MIYGLEGRCLNSKKTGNVNYLVKKFKVKIIKFDKGVFILYILI